MLFLVYKEKKSKTTVTVPLNVDEELSRLILFVMVIGLNGVQFGL